ncbi:MAG: FecR domain-containing protein [Caulobacterales bacterium]|nr:FecR domain-containing protein [Caulobacterales bacterium]
MTTDRAPTTLADEAAEAFAALRNEATSEAERAAIARRRRDDPEFEAEFVALEHVWELVGDLPADAGAPSAGRGRGAVRRPVLIGAGAALAATLALAIGASLLERPIAPPPPAEELAFATVVGEQRRVTLPDGTQVALNTATALTFRGTPSARIATLDAGQALFEVAPDRARPFRVVAGDVSATALGTAFDVRVRAEGVQVAVLEGLVAVEGAGVGGARWRETVAAGGAALAAESFARLAMDPRDAALWREGLVKFDDASLEEAAGELSRYLPAQIRIGDEAARAARISGVFRVRDADAFVEAVSVAHGLTVVAEDGTIELRAGDSVE